MAEKTAQNSRITPFGEAAKLRSGFRTTMLTPTKDTNNPAKFMMLSFSLKVYHAMIGENKGIVATMTAATVEETYKSPKLSPMK